MSNDELRELLIRHEGLCLKPYTDTVGKITIGVGRNLTDNGITEAEAEILLEHDINTVITEVLSKWPWVSNLNRVRRMALYDMAFNLGSPRLSQFVKMLEALREARWGDAAREALDSKWARQVGVRAHDVSQMFLTGKDDHAHAAQG